MISNKVSEIHKFLAPPFNLKQFNQLLLSKCLRTPFVLHFKLTLLKIPSYTVKPVDQVLKKSHIAAFVLCQLLLKTYTLLSLHSWTRDYVEAHTLKYRECVEDSGKRVHKILQSGLNCKKKKTPFTFTKTHFRTTFRILLKSHIPHLSWRN